MKQETDVAAAGSNVLASPVWVRPRSAEFYTRKDAANECLSRIDVADTVQVCLPGDVRANLVVRLHLREGGLHTLDLISRTRSQCQVTTETLALGKIGVTVVRQFTLPPLPRLSTELAGMVEGYLRVVQVADPRTAPEIVGYAQRVCREFFSRCSALLVDVRNARPDWTWTDIGVDLAYAGRKTNTFQLRKLGSQANTLYHAATTIRPR